jgi:hypothetical protein
VARGATEWLAVAALGLGPMGAAFFLWDIGMKRGDVSLLGVASYAAPVLSTLTLVAAGYTEPGAALWIACAAHRRRRARRHAAAARLGRDPVGVAISVGEAERAVERAPTSLLSRTCR